MASFREQGPTERFEKRGFYRFPVQYPAILGNLSNDMSSICTTWSTKGVSVESSQDLRNGERLMVVVTIVACAEPLRMVGQVMWQRELRAFDNDGRQVNEYGIRFLRPLPSLGRTEEEPSIDGALREEEEEGFVFPRRI